MNEIILVVIYVAIAIIAVWDLTRHREICGRKVISIVLAVILTIGLGFYIPIHKRYEIIPKRSVKY